MASIELQHRTIADMTKPQPPLPTGVWKFRGVKLSANQATRTTKDGDEREIIEYLLTVEPLEPTASVDPAALAEVDERTGKPIYDGKRLYLRYNDDFRSDMQTLGGALVAMGFGPTDDPNKIIEKNLVKGKTAFGELFNRTFTRKDGEAGIEQKVRSWSDKGGGEKFAI